MPKRITIRCLAVACLLISACSARAWWDTYLTVARPIPLVKEIEAEACAGVEPARIVVDSQADGGRGGKAVRLDPQGGALTADFDLKPGLYQLYVIGRNPADKAAHSLMTLDAREHATGQTRSWTMLIAHREFNFAAGRIYFPAYAGGKYTLTVKLAEKLSKPPVDPAVAKFFDKTTLAPTTNLPAASSLLVDRLELRDVLGYCAQQGLKDRRMLTSNEELAKLRQEFKEKQEKGERLVFNPGTIETLELTKGKAPAWFAAGRSAQEREARNTELWAQVPEFNELFGAGGGPYANVIGRDRKGLVADLAKLYQLTGNAELGMDGAILLCALAEKYPAIDFSAQCLIAQALLDAEPFNFSLANGKTVYRGWAGGDFMRQISAYDQLFDFIKGNQALAAHVGKKIPWVKTPADVIKLLDTNFLQAGMDQCLREWISGDAVMALAPLVQGVNPLSAKMLKDGIFSRLATDMTFRGGIDDQSVCGFSRDGVHYIGSVGYINNELEVIGNYLNKYREAAEGAQFDPKREKTAMPGFALQVTDPSDTINAASISGFRMLVGDAGDLRVGRSEKFTPAPSQVLGGFGAAVLASGQFQDDPLKMRGVGLYSGIGRGHAHQDTLNIEIAAHGCRVSPDLGGRHEGRLRGSPNMRWNKVHNLVEVDLKNFENLCPGSTTAGTGWTTGFAPQPGAQFMEHHGRATSHTNVSLYARQTAVIDVGDADSYLFDVFRVRGGQVHTYSFHGCPTTNLQVNAPLAPAKSPEAAEYLRKHFEGTRQEGAVPEILQADWPMRPELQKGYQGKLYQADRPVTMRLALFGHAGEKLLIGNASSESYNYNFPFLYVQGRQEAEGRESVFPALMEPFAGAPFIKEKRLLKISPAQQGAEAGVAVEVKTAGGRTDWLYASGSPTQAVTLEGKVKAAGKFAVLCRDADGLQLAHLVGGTELAADDIAIKTEKPAYRAGIRSVKYAERTFSVDAPLPPRLLRNAVVQLGADRNLHSFTLESLEPEGSGARVTHAKSAKYYQSTILNLDAASGAIETEIEPPVFGCDSQYIKGTTVANEKGDKFWKTDMRQGDRWMDIAWPGYRTSWPNRIALEDVPDTNKDGRRTLKLMGMEADKDEQTNSLAGKVLVELDVTRVAPGGDTFYFKLPADEKYQRGGWQFARRIMINEDGSKTWRALYPGSSYLWLLEGGVKDGDFTDADQDGRIKLCAYLFGPGDRLSVDTFVYVRRTAPGVFEIRANVPCTLALPRGEAGKAQVSVDGETFKPLASKTDGARLEIALAERDLADGKVLIKLEK